MFVEIRNFIIGYGYFFLAPSFSELKFVVIIIKLSFRKINENVTNFFFLKFKRKTMPFMLCFIMFAL